MLPRKSPVHRRGAALIIVLGTLVIVTLMVVAFLSKSTLDSQASSSFSASVSADLLASDAANTVIGGLQSEIHAPAYSTAVATASTPPGAIYIPTSPLLYTMPQMDQTSSTLYGTVGVATATGNNSTLVRSSAFGTGTALFTGDLQGLVSNVPTSTASLNGRVLPSTKTPSIPFASSRWDDPLLLTTTASGRSICPSWIYVNQSGPKQLAAWSTSLTDPTNSQYVTGRFAYRVYDISGLLDMNAAGYPPSEKGTVRVGRKGSLAMADLYDGSSLTVAVPIPGLGFTPATVGTSTFLNWRGPSAVVTTATIPYISGTTSYDAYVNEFGQKYGFMLTPPASYTDSAQTPSATVSFTGVNRFLDRNDLIAMVNSPITSDFNDTAANKQVAFLSGATSFTRELNAPSWGGTDVWTTAGIPLQAGEEPLNPNFSKITVLHPFLRNDGTMAVVGEPLVKTRFPLSKIALLSTPTDANPTANATAIKNYFGLVFVPAGTAGPTKGSRAFDHWEYIGGIPNYGTKGYTCDTRITDTFAPIQRECMLTLADIAAAGVREPNFFELLQAGIYADSLGQASQSSTPKSTATIIGKTTTSEGGGWLMSNQWSDQNIARHILQIGANIIDQYDSDNIPTVIARLPLEQLDANAIAPDPDISGVENVPYIQLIGTSTFRNFNKTDPINYPGLTYTYQKTKTSTPISFHEYPYLENYFQFQLWNPHNNTASSAPAGTFRIVANGAPIPQQASGENSGFGTATPIATFNDTKPDPTPIGLQTFSDTDAGGVQPYFIQFKVPGTNTFADPHLLENTDPNINYSPSNCVFSDQFPVITLPPLPDLTPPSHSGNANATLLGFFAGEVYAPYNGYTTDNTAIPPAVQVYPKYTSDTRYMAPQITPGLKDYVSHVVPGPSGTGSGSFGIAVDSGVTFQLQELNPQNSQWVPVQTVGPITGNFSNSVTQSYSAAGGAETGSSYNFYNDPSELGGYYAHPDPRTMRFGMGFNATSNNQDADNLQIVDPSPSQSAFPDTTSYTTVNAGGGWVATDAGSTVIQNTGANTVSRGVAFGQLAKNIAQAVTQTPGAKVTWYSDRGTAGTSPSITSVQVRVADRVPQDPAMAAGSNPLTSKSARPLFLNRPFESVAELGYVFRDLPWKSLNFSQDMLQPTLVAQPAVIPRAAAPPTADAGLLDIFSVSEAPVRAGVVNLNAASTPVLASLLLGTSLNPTITALATSGTDSVASLSPTDVSTFLTQLQTYLAKNTTTIGKSRPSPGHVLQTAGDLTTMLQTTGWSTMPAPLAGWTKEKTEAGVAALADVHNGRTWNVLIDLYAQSGHFPPLAAGTLSAFQVTGQKHLWVEAAIDRYTGKVVDQIVEQPDDETLLH